MSVVHHDKRDSQLKEKGLKEDEAREVLWPPSDETEGAMFFGRIGRVVLVHEGEEELLVIGWVSG